MFPASLRITKKEFLNLKPKVVYRGEYFDVAKKEGSHFKIACVISKKTIAKAAARNFVRRRILHAFYLFNKTTPLFGYYVIYPKKNSADLSYKNIEEQIQQVFATLQ